MDRNIAPDQELPRAVLIEKGCLRSGEAGTISAQGSERVKVMNGERGL